MSKSDTSERLPKRKMIIPALLVLALISVRCSNVPRMTRPVSVIGETMGTFYAVKIAQSPITPERLAELQLQLNALLEDINGMMSAYEDSSEITLFNNFTDSAWFPVSPSTARVVEQARATSEMSQGAFDITVGPLVNLWGFGPENPERLPPSQPQITLALARTGYHNLQVSLTPPALKKTIPDIYCDLAAVAKGYAVDRISAFLDSAGYRDHLVEIGGEVRAEGTSHRKTPWTVGVEIPDSSFGVQSVVSLSGVSMATSGDYRNYFEKDGVRYSHLIDPRTGRPITHRLVSATVIHKSCLVADAMATAINVLGPEAGYELAVKQNLAAFLIIRDGDRFVERMTADFKKYLSPQSTD
jgi:thiamine biosynthesis lipoprotein